MCPDGWILEDARFQVARVARELCLGFYYRHDPRPPKDWSETRRNWLSFVREIIETSDQYDSYKPVFDAVHRGHLPLGKPLLDAWLAIEPSFTPNTVCTWLSNHALDLCAKWGKDGGIIWTHREEFARALEHATGWAFFSDGGLDSKGRSIEEIKDRTIIASNDSCGVGKNLQYVWSRNLETCFSSSAGRTEQRIGRTHREGQKDHTVYVDYLVGCRESCDAIYRAYDRAGKVETETKLPQKLRLATILWPELDKCSGPAFASNSRK